MIFLILAGLAGAGIYLNNKENIVRENKFNRKTLPKDEIPSGKDIYNSKRYSEVEKHIQALSDEKYAKSRDPVNTGVIPPLFNTLGLNECCDNGDGRPEITNVKRPTSDGGILSTDAQPSLLNEVEFNQQNQIFGGPMFSSMNTLAATDFADISTLGKPRAMSNTESGGRSNILQNEVSLLTGQDIDYSHNNMVPFFGSRQPQDASSLGQRKLENFTGTDDKMNQPKRELEQNSLFGPVPQDVFKSPNIPEELRKERYVQSNLKNNVLPFSQERVASGLNQAGYGTEGTGGFHDMYRPHIRSIDEKRVKTNPRVTYEGRVVTGTNQATQQRGQIGTMNKNRPDTFYINDERRWGGATAAVHEVARRENFNQLKCTNHSNEIDDLAGHAQTHVSESKPSPIRADYLGNPQEEPLTNQAHTGVQSVYRDGSNTTFHQDYIRNIQLEGKDMNDFAKPSYHLLEEERATTGPATGAHQLNVKSEVGEQITHFYDDAKPSIADTLKQNDKHGYVRGQVSNGMGYETAEYYDLPTNRQQTGLRGYTGIGSAHVSENMNTINYYNAHISNRQEKILDTGEFTAGPEKSNIVQGACDENLTIRDQLSNVPHQFDYIPTPVTSFVSHEGMVNNTQFRQNPPKRIDCRLEPDILDAYKKNPFTQSLNSW